MDGVPERRGRVSRVDVRHAAGRFRSFAGEVRSVITSPPYLDTTRFEEDQWLRLGSEGRHVDISYSRRTIATRWLHPTGPFTESWPASPLP
jgi:hypothetical protein